MAWGNESTTNNTNWSEESVTNGIVWVTPHISTEVNLQTAAGVNITTASNEQIVVIISVDTDI